MLPFEWNSLRIGDSVAVHNDVDLATPLQPGSVRIVQTRPGTGVNDIAIRLDTGSMIRPRRGAVHTTPTGADQCWRCRMSDGRTAQTDRTRLPLRDRGNVAPVAQGQRWQSRFDASIVVTVQGRVGDGRWVISAPGDRVDSLITADRLDAGYWLTDTDDTRPTRGAVLGVDWLR